MSFSNWLRKIIRRDSPAPSADAPSVFLGYNFTNPQLLDEALTHRSWANTIGNGSCPTYERLEFLGDSVLGLIVAHFLHRRYPEASEGDLTKKKASLVNVQSLAEIARAYHLGQYVKLSTEEERSGGRDRPSILSDIVESLIGAAYIDGGLTAARGLVVKLLLHDFDRWVEEIAHVNYKGELLEHLQSLGQSAPKYEVVSESGPDHDKTYEIVVWANGRQLGRGQGSAKKDAEQKAAQEALDRIHSEEVL